MRSHKLQDESGNLVTKDCQPGCLAVSLAGHDKGEVFIIINETETDVFLADGRLRTMHHPKRKKKKHIQACKVQLIREFPVTDERIRSVLKHYIKGHCDKGGKIKCLKQM